MLPRRVPEEAEVRGVRKSPAAQGHKVSGDFRRVIEVEGLRPAPNCRGAA